MYIGHGSSILVRDAEHRTSISISTKNARGTFRSFLYAIVPCSTLLLIVLSGNLFFYYLEGRGIMSWGLFFAGIVSLGVMVVAAFYCIVQVGRLRKADTLVCIDYSSMVISVENQSGCLSLSVGLDDLEIVQAEGTPGGKFSDPLDVLVVNQASACVPLAVSSFKDFEHICDRLSAQLGGSLRRSELQGAKISTTGFVQMPKLSLRNL